jgi:hypothetical protein
VGVIFVWGRRFYSYPPHHYHLIYPFGLLLCHIFTHTHTYIHSHTGPRLLHHTPTDGRREMARKLRPLRPWFPDGAVFAEIVGEWVFHSPTISTGTVRFTYIDSCIHVCARMRNIMRTHTENVVYVCVCVCVCVYAQKGLLLDAVCVLSVSERERVATEIVYVDLVKQKQQQSRGCCGQRSGRVIEVVYVCVWRVRCE